MQNHHETNPELKPDQKSTPALTTFLYQLIKLGMRVEVDDKTRENLLTLDQALLKTSAVLFAYHSRLTDALILPFALRNELENLDKILGPVAITHYQGWQKFYLDLVGRLTGSIPLPVVRKKDEASFSQNEKSHLLRQLVSTTNRHLNRPGSLYGIAPMGTRAKTLDSTQVNSGFAKVAQTKQLPALPVAVTHEHGRTQILVGEMIEPVAEQANLGEVVNYYMSQLARLLPNQLRGDYL